MARQWPGGHSASVFCVGASGGPGGLLASGSEAGELTVWTHEGTPLATLRLPGEEDVTCTIFAPMAPNALYVSHGENVSVLDPRNLKGAVQEMHIGEDEINSLSLSETGTILAAADDSGAVRIIDLGNGKVMRTLHRHTNICSSVAFRPQRPQSLLSAGLDMQVMLWNLQKTRPTWSLSLQDLANKEEESPQQRSGQLLNPPLVHCVSVAACGNAVACAAEDGRVHLLRVAGGPRPEHYAALRAHTQGASQAHFLSFMPHPYWLATGGNDSRVALWDVSETVMGAPGGPAASRKKHKGKNLQQREDAQGETRSGSEAKLSFSHTDKVNWLCPAVLKGEHCLLVADQSSTLSVYSLAGM